MKTRITDLFGIELPILQAPMAGVDTPVLAAAVSEAGGLGNIALGALSAAAARDKIAAVRFQTDRPFGVNVFTHATPRVDDEGNARWLAYLRPYFQEFGAEPPPALTAIYASFNDDPALLTVLCETQPPVVSCHFGLPAPDRVSAIKGYGGVLVVTVTTVDEARQAEAAGSDAVVAQGYEAGGHRGCFQADRDERLGTLALVPQVARAVSIPVIAAGGIADGHGIAAALALGADAVQIGTAYIACPDSAVDAGYRALLASERSRSTLVTPVVSGRPARIIRNRFSEEIGEVDAPLPDYPIAYDAGKALAAAAKRAGSMEFSATWAGQHVLPERVLPAGDLTRRLAAEARAELSRLGRLVGLPEGPGAG